MNSLSFTPSLPYIFIIVGFIFIVIALFSKSGVKRLTHTGEHCEGIIFKLGYKEDNTFNRSDSITKDKITVRFETKRKEWITEDLDTNFMITWTGQFKEGQKVQVLYDPNNPSDFTILNNQSPRLVKLIFILAGSICLAIGAYKFFTVV
jgi:uncharacterized protein DUF3592